MTKELKTLALIQKARQIEASEERTFLAFGIMAVCVDSLFMKCLCSTICFVFVFMQKRSAKTTREIEEQLWNNDE